MGERDRRFWGKYRGAVVDNIDPRNLCRLLVEVAAVPGLAFNWAMPCVPFAGFQEGFFAVPAIGAGVWIEFEEGDVSKPIWTGGFWSEGEVPAAAAPGVAVLQFSAGSIVLDGTPEVGSLALRIEPPAVDSPRSITLDGSGITFEGPITELTMVDESSLRETVAGLRSALEDLTDRLADLEEAVAGGS